MENSKKVAKTIRMKKETDELIETGFEESSFDSKGEFIHWAVDTAINGEPTVEVEEVEVKVEVEKKLEANHLLISLTPAQMFVLREHVTRDHEFAKEQNRIIDKMANKPWYASSDVYKPEFQELWVRNIELSDEMEETEKEEATKHNMAAFILNMFLLQLVNYDFQETEVKIEDIEAFIKEQNSKEDEHRA